MPTPWTREDFVTGERLQALAEVTVSTPPVADFHRSLPRSVEVAMLHPDGESIKADASAMDRLRACRVIFVYTHLLPWFFAHALPELRHRFVLVTHNSDASVGDEHRVFLEDGRIARWFAQNARIRHAKLTALPIGVANAQWPHGDLDALVAACAGAPNARREKAYCSFDVRTNPGVRLPLLARLVRSPDVEVDPAALVYGDYLERVAEHRWCICAPGNGVDSHRAWEAMYLGTIPVVTRSAEPTDLYGGLPVLEVDDVGRVDLASWSSASTSLRFDAPGAERLRMDHWRRTIAAAARDVVKP
jgi:hypothetical protein